MSSNLTKTQLIAAQLLGAGWRGVRVAEHLSVRPETLSRWKGESGFNKAMETAYVELLQCICDEQMHLIDKAQEAILRALESDDISEAMRGSLGIRYLSSISGQNNLHQRLKTEVDHKSGAFEESMKACDRIISILDDVHRLTRGRTTISDKEYREIVESLLKKTDPEDEESTKH